MTGQQAEKVLRGIRKNEELTFEKLDSLRIRRLGAWKYGVVDPEWNNITVHFTHSQVRDLVINHY